MTRLYSPYATVDATPGAGAAYVGGEVLYKFDEGSGQDVLDHSGNGHDAYLGSSPANTSNDPTWDARGLLFGSTGEQVNADMHVTNLWSPGPEFSLVWAGRVARSATIKAMVGAFSSTTVRWIVQRLANSDTLRVNSVGTTTHNFEDFFTDEFEDVVVGVTFDGTTLAVYKNGAFFDSTTITAKSAATGDLAFGIRPGTSLHLVGGELHHFSFHHAALDAAAHEEQFDAFAAAVAGRGITYV